MDKTTNQAGSRRVMRDENSIPRLLLCLAAGLGLIGALGFNGMVQGADKSKQRGDGYIWSATRIESGIRLRGSVPSDEDRRTVLGMVKAHFPDLQVEDRLKIARGAPPKDQWLGAVSFGLKQLSHLKRGSARLYDIALKVDGEARSGDDYAEVKKALAGPLPTGLIIAGESIRPPIADPFVFVADLDANALSLSGSVPNENARKEVRELSRQLFRRPGLDDRLELASGAPKNWDEAVAAALRALSQLESGKIALSGLAVTIQGVAPDKGTAVVVSYQLRRDLPALFSTSESISWKEAASRQDVAARLLPRIKEMARTEGRQPDGGLPDLLPLADDE
jgi:OOP family OmpA-OmpF porin